ncbi:hypothetical protein FIBSPDRAFT_960376 [Athelia psychrophila]|uniref:Uncharacterized protein n=1 Tax=Athelia psychrophila TaxID=1759441 RepID=A0A166CIH4_9AGAM|nr:hypothetical protein FIBSPDRAFT_960376 [Fibularhizoctonia sp. CBS 109695]
MSEPTRSTSAPTVPPYTPRACNLFSRALRIRQAASARKPFAMAKHTRESRLPPSRRFAHATIPRRRRAARCSCAHLCCGQRARESRLPRTVPRHEDSLVEVEVRRDEFDFSLGWNFENGPLSAARFRSAKYHTFSGVLSKYTGAPWSVVLSGS